MDGNQKMNGLNRELVMMVRKRQPDLDRRRISCVVDCETCHHLDLTRLPVEILLDFAIQNSPDGSEILISVLQSPDGLELEIADSGEMPAARESSIPIQIEKAKRMLESVDGDLELMPCPQGGTAYILTLRNQPHKAAA